MESIGLTASCVTFGELIGKTLLVAAITYRNLKDAPQEIDFVSNKLKLIQVILQMLGMQFSSKALNLVDLFRSGRQISPWRS